MYKLVLMRHGQSIWNLENRFTGWVDVDLTDQGRKEAKAGAQMILDADLSFDIAYTSVLKRAIRTLWITLDEMDLMWLPVHRSWRLNERHYGALQGLNKTETAEKHGADQVKIWRRSFDIPPPSLNINDEGVPHKDPRYSNVETNQLPFTESLKETISRFLPFWFDEIVPTIKSGKRVLICAHGNSLRALVKHLDGISDQDISELNIPTGIPLVYELDKELSPIKNYYLGDPEAAKKAAEAVAQQAGSGKK